MASEKKGPQKSGRDEVSFINSKLKNLKIKQDKKEINVLLLGETGVGKSTFINAFFNYISFPSLSEARKQKLQVVVPTQFTITDEEYKERTIKVGEDHNESIEIGASATQACRSYIYKVPETNLKIRLIDTPGIGDTRGIDQDNINFENVLSHIGELKHLNGICILLKPNNSRLTVMFEFCIKQLLSKLEKTASDNLIFVFTNTRSTFYRPGETLPSLKKLLSTVKTVNILCEKKNIFCTDNESFRFLAALKSNVQFSSTDINNFSQSWTQSYDECMRMIAYIVGDDTNAGLPPHDVKNTISVNEARRLIVQLSQPLAEIAQLVQDNIRAIDKHQQVLADSKTTLSELKSKLYVPIIDLNVKKLDQPTTVCTSIKCSTVYQVGDKKKWHYRQKCHCPCYLQNVPKEIIGTPELMSCAAMNGQGECRQCSCKYQVHMHIYYETEAFENKLEDAQIKTKIMTKEQAQKIAHSLTLKLSNRLSALNKEKDTILKTTAKFACFLKTNAISPYNDAYEAYLKYLIDREKSLNEACDLELIKQLERMLGDYVQEKNTILNAITRSNSNMVITADDIINSIKLLESLDIFGSKIKELYEAQNRARKNENTNVMRETVVEFFKTAKSYLDTCYRGRRNQTSHYSQNAQFTSNRPPFRQPRPHFNQRHANPLNVGMNQNPWIRPYPNCPPSYDTSQMYAGMNYPNHPPPNPNQYPSSYTSYNVPPSPIYSTRHYPISNHPPPDPNQYQSTPAYNVPPSPIYSTSYNPINNPLPALLDINAQPPDYFTSTNTKRKPQKKQQSKHKPNNIKPQPCYQSEPETVQRKSTNRKVNDKKHNLHASSSSSASEDEYFSSTDRRH